MKKIGVALQTPVFLYKSGVKWVYISRTCFPDDMAAVGGYQTFNIFLTNV